MKIASFRLPNKVKVKSKKALIKKKKNGLRATKFIYGIK
jgi:hypothetical protein